MAARVVETSRPTNAAPDPVAAPVSVVMVVKDESEERLTRRFSDLAAQRPNPPDEVVVAADPSSPREVIAVERAALAAGVAVTVVANGGGARSAGLNRAVRAASHELIVRVDARSHIFPGHVAGCVRVLTERQEVGMVGGQQLPRAGAAGAQAAGIARALANPWALGGAAYRRADAAGAVDTVYLGAFRRRDVLDLGGYEERLAANEDFDLCQRLRAHGKVVWLEPALAATYEARTSRREVYRQYRAFGQAKGEYLRLRGDRPSRRQALALGGGALALLATPAFVRRPGRLAAAAVVSYVSLLALDEIGSPGRGSLAERHTAAVTMLSVWAGWMRGVVGALIRPQIRGDLAITSRSS